MTKNELKIITVVGARPQFVKAAALSPRLSEVGLINELIVHTGQHFDKGMSDIFFEEMNIPSPSVNLGIGGGSHGQNTGRMIEALERVFIDNNPDVVLVYGDTDSTLAASVAAAKLDIPIAHVEAGLRSHRRAMPEEINRVLTDHVSNVLYAPSQSAVDNLINEGIAVNKIINSGDVMLDVVKRFSFLSKEKSSIISELGLSHDKYRLMTLHRKENVDDKDVLSRIISAVGDADMNTLFLVHPRTVSRIKEFGLVLPSFIRVIDPVGYFDMIALIKSANVVLTDSGGLQKEAFFLGRPCITLRDETEWIELINAGVNVLTGSDPELIANALYKTDWSIESKSIYGNGDAADIIARDLYSRFG